MRLSLAALLLLHLHPHPHTTPPQLFGCGPALAYLHAHQAPGFRDVCAPHSAAGHYASTYRWDPVRLISIACPVPVAYMNEAANSRTFLTGHGRIDPFGQGTAADAHRCQPYL